MSKFFKYVQNLIDQGRIPDQRESPDFSARIDFFLWLKSNQLNDLIDQLEKEIDALSARKKRNSETQSKFRFILQILLINLLLLHKDGRRMTLALPKSSGFFSYENRFNNPNLSFRTFKEAYSGLLKLNYIKEYKGYFDIHSGSGKVTRISATEKLRQKFDQLFPQSFLFFSRQNSEELICLKDQDKKLIDYSDTNYTSTARTNLHLINNCLSRHWFDLEINRTKIEELYQRMDAEYEEDNSKPSFLNLNDKSMYRVFNNGLKDSNNNFSDGGRFYGGWWQGIPSEYRTYITIDQKHTVEVDYSNLHPAMLYAMEGITLVGDAYSIEGVSSVGRKMVKVAFNKFINGNDYPRKPMNYDEATVGIPWKDLTKALEEKHTPIKQYFQSGYGVKLQRIDADIAESVLLHFAKHDWPCLPIHDSFIIHQALLDELKDVMQREYNKAFNGFNIALKVDNYFEVLSRKHAKEVKKQSHDIEDLLLSSETAPYEQRWHLWLEHKGKLL